MFVVGPMACEVVLRGWSSAIWIQHVATIDTPCWTDLHIHTFHALLQWNVAMGKSVFNRSIIHKWGILYCLVRVQECQNLFIGWTPTLYTWWHVDYIHMLVLLAKISMFVASIPNSWLLNLLLCLLLRFPMVTVVEFIMSNAHVMYLQSWVCPPNSAGKNEEKCVQAGDEPG